MSIRGMKQYFSSRFERLHHFDAVSEGIIHIEAVIPFQWLILNHRAACGFKSFSKL